MTCPVHLLGAATTLPLLLATAGRSQPIPTPDHVVIAIMENHTYGQIIGSPNAPYINNLASQGALLTNSFAVTHPSQPNYIALYSGSQQGLTNNDTPTNLPFVTPNLGAQLMQAGRTFAGFSEDLPSVGFTGDSAGGASGYVRRHNPWVNWQQVGSVPHPANTLPATTNLPFSLFPTDYANLPTLSFVVPNLLNDMHDGTIAQGDGWLSANLNGYAQWAKTHNSLLVVTFDEDDSSATNQIATILFGQTVRAGVTTNQLINHFNLLATFEDMYSLPRVGNAVGVTSLNGIWTPVPEPSTFLLVTLGGLGLFGRRWAARRRGHR
jgi:acid phosphatase